MPNMLKETTPKVAVITRTKNRPLLLERALQSIYAQTMTDFVHVIVNDGGDQKVIEALLAKYDTAANRRVKLIHNQTSLGMEPASNKGIKSVDSTYIAIHDDDDTWHPDFLLKTTEHLDKTGAMGVVVTTDKVEEAIENRSIRTLHTDRWHPGLREISLYEQCLDNYATPITFLYRRSVFDTIGYYDEQLPVSADWDFAVRFLLEYDIDFLATEQALAFYHHRPAETDINGNSVFKDSGVHEHYMNVLRNKYLRADIKAGRLGVGYIMNDLTHERARQRERDARMRDQTVRLEGHINYATEQAKRLLQEYVDHKFERFTMIGRVGRLRRKGQ